MTALGLVWLALLTLSLAANVVFVVALYKVTLQIRAVSRHIQLLTRRVERSTGQVLPHLAPSLLEDEPPPPAATDWTGVAPSIRPWDVPHDVDPVQADRQARRG